MTDPLENSRTLYIEVGKRIRAERIKAAMTQRQLAQKISGSRTSVTNIEAGRQKVLVDTLYAIAAVLNTDISNLLPARTPAFGEAGILNVPSSVTDRERQAIEQIVSKTPVQRKRRAGERKRRGES